VNPDVSGLFVGQILRLRLRITKDENKYQTRNVLFRNFIGEVTGIMNLKIRSFVRRSRYRFLFWDKDEKIKYLALSLSNS